MREREREREREMTRKFVNRRTALDFKQTSPQLWKIHDEQIGNAKECVARVKHNIAIKYQCRAAVICDFFLFCHERQMIWKRRFGSSQAKRRPWTKDEIMRKYFFCNIYRELDGGTLYFQQHINNIIPSNKKHNQKTIEKVLWASLCYRLMNQEDTFKVSVSSCYDDVLDFTWKNSLTRVFFIFVCLFVTLFITFFIPIFMKIFI